VLYSPSLPAIIFKKDINAEKKTLQVGVANALARRCPSQSTRWRIKQSPPKTHSVWRQRQLAVNVFEALHVLGDGNHTHRRGVSSALLLRHSPPRDAPSSSGVGGLSLRKDRLRLYRSLFITAKAGQGVKRLRGLTASRMIQYSCGTRRR
jgi:hypothetical protein